MDDPVGDDDVVGGGVPIRLLVVEGEVLHHGDRSLALHPLDIGGGDLAGEIRVLAVRLVGPAPPRVTDDIDRWSHTDVDALSCELAPDHGAVLAGLSRVPGGSGADRRRQLGHSGQAMSDTGCPVGDGHRRDAERGDGQGVALIGADDPMHHVIELCEAHPGHHHGGACGRRRGGIDPRAARRLGRQGVGLSSGGADRRRRRYRTWCGSVDGPGDRRRHGTANDEDKPKAHHEDGRPEYENERSANHETPTLKCRGNEVFPPGLPVMDVDLTGPVLHDIGRRRWVGEPHELAVQGVGPPGPAAPSSPPASVGPPFERGVGRAQSIALGGHHDEAPPCNGTRPMDRCCVRC